jgi:hypothetical protein
MVLPPPPVKHGGDFETAVSQVQGAWCFFRAVPLVADDPDLHPSSLDYVIPGKPFSHGLPGRVFTSVDPVPAILFPPAGNRRRGARKGVDIPGKVGDKMSSRKGMGRLHESVVSSAHPRGKMDGSSPLTGKIRMRKGR